MKHLLFVFLLLPISAFADDLIMSNVPNGCSADLKTNTYLRPNFVRSQYLCNSGEYLPANTDHCEICSDIYNCNGGTYTFNENENQGIDSIKTHIDRNITGGCKALFIKPINNVANITATYEPNTITINWDDGTNTVQNTCTYGGAITLPPTPVRPGYVFGGWRVKKN